MLKGFLCDPAAGREGAAQILIRKGRIEAVLSCDVPAVSDLPVLDVGQHLVLPGLVDMHVHLREPGAERAETVTTGTAAAVAGGFTSVACMPNTSPPLDSAARVSFVKEKARQSDLARVYPVGALTVGQQGTALCNLEAMAEAGAIAFSDDGRSVQNSRLLLEALERTRLMERLLIEHCEDPFLAAGGVVYPGETARKLGLPAVSRAAEPAMVARDLVLQQQAGGALHLAHLSTRESLELLSWALARGQDVSAEITPHHLLLTEASVQTLRADAKMNPPLGSADDRQALQEALCRGLVAIVATDHAPHPQAEKARHLLEAPFGVVGLETAFALLFTFLVERGLLTLSSLVQAMSSNPARRLKIPGGTLAPGASADICVVDLTREWRVEQDSFFSGGKNTPFQGWKLRGLPVLTLVDGDLKMFEGRVKAVSDDFPAWEEIIAAGKLPGP